MTRATVLFGMVVKKSLASPVCNTTLADSENSSNALGQK